MQQIGQAISGAISGGLSFFRGGIGGGVQDDGRVQGAGLQQSGGVDIGRAGQVGHHIAEGMLRANTAAAEFGETVNTSFESFLNFQEPLADGLTGIADGIGQSVFQALQFDNSLKGLTVGIKTLKNVFRDFFRQLIADFVRAIAKALILKGLMAVLGPAAGGGGFIGGVLGRVFGGFRANGGPVSAGKSYVVGERGLELFTPSTSGHITPLAGAVSGMGGMAIPIRATTVGIKDDQLLLLIESAQEKRARQKGV